MANDGTLNQRESGVGIFDQLTFQNDTPIGGLDSETEKEEESRQAHEAVYGDNINQPAPEESAQPQEKTEGAETYSDGSMFGYGSEETQQAFDEAEGTTPLEVDAELAQESETYSDGSMFGYGSEETQQAFDEAEGTTPLEVDAELAQESETHSDGSMFGYGSEETQQAFDEAEQQEIEQGTEPAVEQETGQELEAE